MTTSRRLVALPLMLIALLALLALGGVLLWSTPADAQPVSRILVSNVSQSNNERVDLDGNDHAQLFHTAAKTGGWVLTSLIVVSEDSQGDDFDVEICEAHNSTEFPTSTCTRLSRPSSFAAGSLKFTHSGIHLNANDNYVAVFKQAGNEDVSLDATTSAGEDSTGLSGWSIKDKFDWNDGGTWRQKGGSSNEAILITVNGYEARAKQDATGRPVILASAEGAPYLFADTSGIADGNGLPFTGQAESVIEFTYSYQWIRVDGGSETNIGKQIKVEVSFTDLHNYSETVTSRPFGPITEPDPLPSPSTLVSNTGHSASATATITMQYAMEFTLGDHGQGYEISSVSIDLAVVPSDLTVSLWIGKHSSQSSVPETKLFDFENPSSFAVGMNRFTAPAGVLAYQSVRYYIVLSGFGSSLSINETTSDGEDDGGEAGAELGNKAHLRALNATGRWSGSPGRDNVLRLAVEGSRRASGILASTYAQPFDGDQEIISAGDECCFRMGVGPADRYLIRGFSWLSDDSTPRGGGITNPFNLIEGTSSTGAKQFRVINTRNAAGITEWTAPQGATVEGGSSKTYIFRLDVNFLDHLGSNTRLGGTLTRIWGPPSGSSEDVPPALGVTLSQHGDVEVPYAPYMAVLGEPLNAMVQNLGQADDGYSSVGGTNKVLSQGFTTGSDADGYELLGIGVNIEGSGSNFPDGPTSVSVAVHADSSGQPGAKLFDLVSPTEFAAGHSFFEAPPGTTLEGSTSYVMVWSHLGGTVHRMRKTSSNSEDSGGLTGFSIANVFYQGADLDNMAADSGSDVLEIAVYGPAVNVENATGAPRVLASAEDAGILAVDTSGIGDPDGIPNVGSQESTGILHDFSYRWIRVDGDTESKVGADSARYRRVDADIGKLIKVEVSFFDNIGNSETVTSLPFGPVAEPAGPQGPTTTLVSNTGQSASATANITQRYDMGFKLGTHGQGYEISSVSIDLAAVPSSLTVSLWMGPTFLKAGTVDARGYTKLFDFENPSSFQVGLNRFTAPAGAFAYQNVDYYIVLSDFGSSLSIKETTSDDEDEGGETGATLRDSAGGDSSVLRLAVEGSKRARGILISTYTQVADEQEIVSLGDELGVEITVGAADRYLIRGVTFSIDDTTNSNGGFTNPWELRDGTTELFRMVSTRQIFGINEFTAPQGATVEGSDSYVFFQDMNSVDRMGGRRSGPPLLHLVHCGGLADGDRRDPRRQYRGIRMRPTADGRLRRAARRDGAEPGADRQQLRLRRRPRPSSVVAGFHDRFRRVRVPAAGHRHQHRRVRQRERRRPIAWQSEVRVGGRARRFGREAGREAVRPRQSHRIRTGPQLLRGAAGNASAAGHLLRAGVEPPRRALAQASADHGQRRGLGRSIRCQRRGRVLPGRQRGQPVRGLGRQRVGVRGVHRGQRQGALCGGRYPGAPELVPHTGRRLCGVPVQGALRHTPRKAPHVRGH